MPKLEGKELLAQLEKARAARTGNLELQKSVTPKVIEAAMKVAEFKSAEKKFQRAVLRRAAREVFKGE